MNATAVTATAVPADATLDRRLGPLDAAAIVISNVIGGGIFFVPIIVAGLVPSGWALLGVWLFGGVLAFTGAMAYAELAVLRPRAGGEYVYLRDAYGRLAAFLSGWTSFVAGFSGAIAAGAVALADYIGHFAPFAKDRTPLLTIPLPYVPVVVTPHSVIAITAIVLLSMIHLHSAGRIVHNLLASLKVSALLLFIALGFSLGAGSLGNIGGTHAVAAPATGWLLALIPVMFSYSGWNAAAYVAEEIRDPHRNLPLSLALGTLAVVAIYMALNVLYLYALPLSELATTSGGLTNTVAERLFGFVAGDVLAVFTIVSIAALISAMVWAGPRVYYAMARDGLFFQAAGRVHPRFRTPVLAIVAQAIWSSVLVLAGTLSQLVEYTGFAVVLFSGIAVLAVFVLRHREPDTHRPFKAFGYPWAPAFFVIVSAAIVANGIWSTPGTSLIGLSVIAAGIPLYVVFQARRGR
ncbi:MAG TPA: amino acid permease [Vicinamibacterales bacterium]|nr:amino acid permease [Vicinamibacterales bacterium]